MKNPDTCVYFAYVATAPELKDKSGSYIDQGKIKLPSKTSRSVWVLIHITCTGCGQLLHIAVEKVPHPAGQ